MESIGRRWRWPTLFQIRAWTGVVIGTYVTLHLSNHALGLISVHAQETARPWVMMVWHSWPGQIALYGSLITHAILGLYALGRRRHYRMPAWEGMQIVGGLSIPYLLLLHIVNTRGTRVLTGIDIDYVYEIANLWVDPASRYRQVLLVILVWCHFCAGLHFWLRLRAWYRRAFPAIVLFYAMVPSAALLGFAEVGMTMTAHERADPAWFTAIKAHGVPTDPQRAHLRAELKQWVGYGWLCAVAVVFLIAQIRNAIARARSFVVTYPQHQTVRAPIGMSILEVSRLAGRPHMSVCGGRARCTTCRVRVIDTVQEIPPPSLAEAKALARINAPPGLRLACQTRPVADLEIQPLLNPTVVSGAAAVASIGQGGSNAIDFGQERQVTVLFIDVRGSTTLHERRMPYDVVFLLNQFFEQMAQAIEHAGGLYSNFTGDGLMALFGLPPYRDAGAKSALICAADMLARLDALNERLHGELAEPIAIGIGVHTGVAIIGRMGPPKSPIVTALGDTVNVAARLEGLSKEFKSPLIVSESTLTTAKITDDVPLTETPIRGKESKLSVAALDRQKVDALIA
jgi:adenylate cyclase